jgi:thiamine-monophosphate kinase
VLAAGARAGVALSCIGRLEAAAGLRLRTADGQVAPVQAQAFDHFAD